MIRAILTAPQEDAFRERCGVTGAIETHFEGWSKRVILASDRVFLFPRDHTRVAGLDREAMVLQVLSGWKYAPQLIGYHTDTTISPYPFLELARVTGAPFYGQTYEAAADLNIVLDLMSQVGSAIAALHDRSTEGLAPDLSQVFPRPGELLQRVLVSDPARLIEEATTAIGVPAADGWSEALAAVQAITPVLTHGDVHGEQLMTDDSNRLTGIIDWETASVDNPVRDFNFNEWGRGWYRAHEHEFALLRETLWTAYADGRTSVSLPRWQAIDVFYCLLEAWQCAMSTHTFDVERRPLALTNLQAATRAFESTGV